MGSGKIITKRRIDYTEDDWGPDFLLASNGGYNPKQKTIYAEEETTVVNDDNGVEETYKTETQPMSTLDYAQMLKNNINSMRITRAGGTGRNRVCLKQLSKNHYKS